MQQKLSVTVVTVQVQAEYGQVDEFVGETIGFGVLGRGGFCCFPSAAGSKAYGVLEEMKEVQSRRKVCALSVSKCR